MALILRASLLLSVLYVAIFYHGYDHLHRSSTSSGGGGQVLASGTGPGDGEKPPTPDENPDENPDDDSDDGFVTVGKGGKPLKNPQNRNKPANTERGARAGPSPPGPGLGGGPRNDGGSRLPSDNNRRSPRGQPGNQQYGTGGGGRNAYQHKSYSSGGPGMGGRNSRGSPGSNAGGTRGGTTSGPTTGATSGNPRYEQQSRISSKVETGTSQGGPQTRNIQSSVHGSSPASFAAMASGGSGTGIPQDSSSTGTEPKSTSTGSVDIATGNVKSSDHKSSPAPIPGAVGVISTPSQGAPKAAAAPATKNDPDDDKYYIFETTEFREKDDPNRFLLVLIWPESWVTYPNKEGKNIYETTNRFPGYPPNVEAERKNVATHVTRVRWIDANEPDRAPGWHRARNFSVTDKPQYKYEEHYTGTILGDRVEMVWPPRHVTVHGLWQDFFFNPPKRTDAFLKNYKSSIHFLTDEKTGLDLPTKLVPLAIQIMPDLQASTPHSSPTSFVMSTNIHVGIKSWTGSKLWKEPCSFWRNEWIEHGYTFTYDPKCAHYNIKSPQHYFGIIMTLWQRYELTGLLRTDDPGKYVIPAGGKDQSDWLDKDDPLLQDMFLKGKPVAYTKGNGEQYGVLSENIEPLTPGYAGSKATFRTINKVIRSYLIEVIRARRYARPLRKAEDLVPAKSFYITCRQWLTDKIRPQPENLLNEPVRLSATFEELNDGSEAVMLAEIILCIKPGSLELIECRKKPARSKNEIQCPTGESEADKIYIP